MMRIMGLDYGSKTIGVAISDPLGLTARESKLSVGKMKINSENPFAGLRSL